MHARIYLNDQHNAPCWDNGLRSDCVLAKVEPGSPSLSTQYYHWNKWGTCVFSCSNVDMNTALLRRSGWALGDTPPQGCWDLYIIWLSDWCLRTFTIKLQYRGTEMNQMIKHLPGPDTDPLSWSSFPWCILLNTLVLSLKTAHIKDRERGNWGSQSISALGASIAG